MNTSFRFWIKYGIQLEVQYGIQIVELWNETGKVESKYYLIY